MSTAGTTPEHSAGREDRAPSSAPPRGPSSPGSAAGWLLRAAALAAVAAGAMGVVVAPGIRGNAGEKTVDWVDRASSTLSYFLLMALVAAVGWGAVELARDRERNALPRIVLVGSSTSAVALVFVGMAIEERLASHALPALLVSAVSVVCALAGAYAAVRAPHTRATAGVLLALAFAALAHLGAWELATSASERANLRLYSVSRGLSTAGILLEAAGQVVAVTWLGTRSKLGGQLGSFAALAIALVLTWGVARGVHSGAALWQSVLHTALADAPGVPPPFGLNAGLDAMATFLVPASMLLALVAAIQRSVPPAVAAAMALALVSRGSFDAPLRGLCVVAAAQWAALASLDERAMWSTLLGDRKRRLAEDDV